MKRIINILILLTMVVSAYGQVAIGKEVIDGNSTILDFYDNTDNTNGIILPSVDDLSKALSNLEIENNGTFLLDKSDRKVKMRQNNVWVELSKAGNLTALAENFNPSIELGSGVIIGAETTQAVGVLVLESLDRALVLPKISNPHINVKNPYPGMLCFDTTIQALAVFDGSVWNYWK